MFTCVLRFCSSSHPRALQASSFKGLKLVTQLAERCQSTQSVASAFNKDAAPETLFRKDELHPCPSARRAVTNTTPSCSILDTCSSSPAEGFGGASDSASNSKGNVKRTECIAAWKNAGLNCTRSHLCRSTSCTTKYPGEPNAKKKGGL